MKKILLVGGGSGGHIIPLKPIAERLTGEDTSVHVLTTNSALDKKIVEENFENITHHGLSTDKIRAYRSWKNILAPLKILRAIFTARRIVKAIQPDVVFLKGGFLCFPVAVAAKFLMSKKIPMILHESDILAGPLTKILMKLSDKTLKSFDNKNPMPLMAEQKDITVMPHLEQADRPVLVVCGGSQGAKFLNNLVVSCRDFLEQYMHTALITGPKKSVKDWNSGHFEQHEMLTTRDLQRYILSADVLLIRSGAGLLFEVVTAKKPSITVPHPHGRGYHQYYNARFFADRGLTKMIEEKDITPNIFIKDLQNIMKNKEMQQNLQASTISNKASHVADIIQSYL